MADVVWCKNLSNLAVYSPTA